MSIDEIPIDIYMVHMHSVSGSNRPYNTIVMVKKQDVKK